MGLFKRKAKKDPRLSPSVLPAPKPDALEALALLAAVARCPCCDGPTLNLDGYINCTLLAAGATQDVTCARSGQTFRIRLATTPEENIRIAASLGENE